MSTVVIKRMRAQQQHTQSKPAPARSKPRPEQDNTGLIVGIVTGAIVAIVALVMIIAAAGKRPAGPRSGKVTAQREKSTASDGQDRYAELGGMTMKEWCQANEKKNAELQARKQRMLDHKRGAR